jgi:O-antigen/teichoic acid export membrane protein
VRLLENLKLLTTDTILYGLSSVITQLAGLILVPFYTKELSPEEYGIIALLAMISLFLNPILNLGLDSALFRYFAMGNSNFLKTRLFSSAFFTKILLITIIILILIAGKNFINEFIFDNIISNELYYVFLASVFVQNSTSLAFVCLRVDRRVKQIVIANLVGLVVSLTLSIWLVLILKIGVIGVFIAALFSSAVQGAIFIFLIKSMIHLKFVGFKKIRLLFDYGIPLIPHKLIHQSMNLLVLFLINNYLGIITAGLYAVSKKFGKPLAFIISMVQTAWSPYKFEIHKNETNPALTFKYIISIYWIAIIYIWAILSIITPSLFKYLIDDRYWDGISYVPFIMFVSVCEGFKFTVSTGFELSKDQKQVSKISLYTLLLTLIIIVLSFDYFKPYNFILSQIFSFLFFGVFIYTKAKRIILIKYPFKLILFFLTLSLIIVAYAYLSSINIEVVLALILIQTFLGFIVVVKLFGFKKLKSKLCV